MPKMTLYKLLLQMILVATLLLYSPPAEGCSQSLFQNIPPDMALR